MSSYADVGLTEEEAAYQLANLDDTKAPSIIASVFVLSILSTIAVGARLAIRWRTKAGFKADDYLIVVAGLLCWGGAACTYFETQHGLGRHILAVTPEMFERLLKEFLYQGPNFILGVLLTQLSLLFLYKRIFSLGAAWFRMTYYALLFFVLSINVPIFFVTLFQCTPFRLAWDKSVEGRCINVRQLYLVHTVLILVLDLCIVAAPMPHVRRLHTTAGTKGAVAGMFLLGGFVCVINAIKLPYLAKEPGADALWTDVPASIWTHAELCLGVVSACLPCCKPVLRGAKRMLDSWKSISSGKSLSSAPRSKGSADAYKCLDGHEPSGHGSKMELVPSDRWTLEPRTEIKGGWASEDIERGVPRHAIGVTRDVDVSSMTAK